MLTGLDILIEKKLDLLKNKRVGLVVNPTSLNSDLFHAVHLLGKYCKLTTLFGPEHGIWGNAQDMENVGCSVDKSTGLPVYSLYGDSEESLYPTIDMLSDIDILVFDMQDIGSRYYTFIYTMAMCMERCSDAGLEVLVCDRPNPIGGLGVEGNLVGDGYRSFVGFYPVANRHGMTLGELALLFNTEFNINCSLRVIEMSGWQRGFYYEDTELFWVSPSPNMPSIDTAFVYPGMCFLEGTNISEGRGTTRPFELFGAPYISPDVLVQALSALNLPGVLFRPTFFKPTFQKWAGQVCGGAQVHITDRSAFRPVITGIGVVKTIRELYPDDFIWRTEMYEFRDDVPAFDLLAGGSQTRFMIENGSSIRDISESWEPEMSTFLEVREKYLLY